MISSTEKCPAELNANPGDRILIVDDEPNISDALRLILERSGYVVSTSENGAEALSIITEEQFLAMLA